MLIHCLLSLGNNAPKGQEGRATRQVTEVSHIQKTLVIFADYQRF